MSVNQSESSQNLEAKMNTGRRDQAVIRVSVEGNHETLRI